MTHHSAQDIAGFGGSAQYAGLSAQRPAANRDPHQELLKDNKPAYIRVGRNAVEDVYEEGNVPFVMDKATCVHEGNDIAIIATGEMVKPSLDAAKMLEAEGISCRVLDMYSVKPIDKEAVIQAAEETQAIITVEEHSIFEGWALWSARSYQTLPQKGYQYGAA